MKKWKWTFAMALYLIFVFGLSTIQGDVFKKFSKYKNLDKATHGVLYSGFGFLVSAQMPAPLALIAGAAVGAMDENYQRFTPGRDCSLLDWMMDIAGTSFGILLWEVFFRKRGKKS